MLRILNHFKPHHFKEVVPECFDITFSELENEIKKRKLRLNKKNMIQVLVSEVERSDWEVNDLLTTTFNLELEYMIKHSNQFEWNTSKFVGNSNQGEITDFGHLIQTEVRRDSKDALVLVKKVDDFFWISVIMKNLKKVGIYEKPRYVVLSSEGRYFFTKDNRSTTIVKYIMSTLGYEKEKSIKLTGRSLKSLIKLLARKEKADMNNRPAYEGGTANEKEHGYDFTQKACYNEYFNKCVGGETDIDLQRYTITAMNCPWVGDDTPVLKDMEFKSAMTLSGDAARIIRQLPIASIVRPPIPNYLRNFSVQGRNVVSIKSSMPACERQKGALRLLRRFRSNERCAEKNHDNVANNLGEDCDLTGKKGLVLGAFVCGDEMKLSASAQKFNECTGCKISDFLNDLCTPMKLGNSVVFTNLDQEYFNVCVVSVGKEEVGYNRIEELDECKENIRVAAGVGARKLRETGVTCINFDGMGHPESSAEGAQLAVWRYQDFKCKDDQIKIANIDLYGDDDKEAWQRGVIKAECQNIARKLSDCPANCMTPAIFAQTAIDILCPCGVQIEVRDKDWMETKKMNAFLSVAKGSCEPPVFLELGYCGGSVEEKPIVLIGKGITFDSGGLCLGPCKGMDEMRSDMAGAAVVVGVIKAAASMSLPLNIRGLIPLCENMPSGMALKPGDVVHSMAGKTILVQDTSNEGRLCIADAMTYGQIEYKPRMMIDVATLTMGMKRALGAGATGVFANDEDIWKELQKAGSITGDRVWRFPLWQHFTDKVINFPEVDLHNVGLGVGGDPCLGAAFLQEFVCVDWLHLDISGTGMQAHGEEIPYLPKGRMTGRPTRTIVQFLYQIACLGNKGEDD